MTYNIDLQASFVRRHIQRSPLPYPVIPVQPEPWMDGALCTQMDPEPFFPEGIGASAHEAKRICSMCDVTASCLAYALEHNERDGIWGGMTPNDRKRLRKAGAA